MIVPPALEARLKAFSAKHRSASLTIRDGAKPRGLVLAVDGSLDGDNAADFRELVSAAFAEAHVFGGIVIDLSSVKYISSAGVGALTFLLAEAKQHEIPFYLMDMQDHTKAVFDVLGFTSFFSCVDAKGDEQK
jgi:stage II sporulation protein AA (anti-sigma F factor antagonist)